MEEILKQILEENKKMNITVEGLVKVTKGLAKDVKGIKAYLSKGIEVDLERIKDRLKVLEDNQKIC